MELNGKDDYVARWLHGLCAIPLLMFLAYETWAMLNGSFLAGWWLVKVTLCGYSLYVVFFRLLRYAFTGEGSINREMMDHDL